METQILLILLVLILSAFFSGMEIAFVSASKLRIELLKKKEKISGKILSKYFKNPTRFIGTTLVGNNITLVIYGIIMASMLEPILERYFAIESDLTMLTVQTIISTIVVLILGEFIPKVIFRLKADVVLALFVIPFEFFYYTLSPLVLFFVWISQSILKLFFKDLSTKKPPFLSEHDLEYFLKESDQQVLEEETNVNPRFFEKALDLKEVKIRECMIPRTEIVSIDVNKSVEELEKLFIESGVSRVIVYKDTVDNILGYVHHYEMLSKPENIRSVVMPISLVPESMNSTEALELFIKKKNNIVWVVDEFGGTAGIVTLEDILEEIIGEIEDEFDVEELVEKEIAEYEYIFSARLEIDYLNEKYNLDIPEGDYETLGGYILLHSEKIPEIKEEVILNNFEIVILEAQQNKIEKVKVKLLEPPESSS